MARKKNAGKVTRLDVVREDQMQSQPRQPKDNDLAAAYADDKRFVAKIHDWFRDTTRATEEWRNNAIESLQFCSGNQWSEEDLKVLQEQQRPTLVINKILGPVLFLSGIQRQQRADPAILPFESNDVRGAEILNYLLKWHSTVSREPKVDSQVFLDKIITGLGFWKIRVRYDDDPEGQLVWERVNPLSIYADPNWLDAGWENARYCMQATWVDLEEAVHTWPEHSEEIKRQYGEWLREGTAQSGSMNSATLNSDSSTGETAGDSLAAERTFWDKETQRVRLLEVWYARYVTVEVAVDQNSGEATGDPTMVARMKQAIKLQPELAGQVKFIKRETRRVWVARILGDILLDHEESPFEAQEFPIFPTCAYYFWRHPIGLVDLMKDPQRWFNRHRSTIMEIVRRAAHSGWLNKQDDGANTEDLEKNVAGVGKVINYRNQPPAPISPPEVPQTLVFLMRAAESEINDVSNITREMVGTTTQRTVSGRAIMARQRGGLITQEPVLDSFRLDKEAAIKFFLRGIQQFLSVSRALRILGSLASRQPQGPEARMIEQSNGPDLAMIVKHSMSIKFDVVVDPANKPWEPSAKVSNFQTLTELAGQFPTPPDVLIDAARDAGVITEDQAVQWRAFIDQMGPGGGQVPGQGPQQAQQTPL